VEDDLAELEGVDGVGDGEDFVDFLLDDQDGDPVFSNAFSFLSISMYRLFR
jgi:hypothetical protein